MRDCPVHHLNGKNIYFIGFMATGKSKVGEELAHMIGWPFFDTDTLVEKAAGKTISEIFAWNGETGFREMERKIVQEVTSRRNHVVALGGGAVLDAENWLRIAGSGITICLSASVETLFARIAKKSHRPLMISKSDDELYEKIESLLAVRQPVYNKAQLSFESREDVSAKDLAKKIFQELQNPL